MISKSTERNDAMPIWIRTPKCAGTSIRNILKNKSIKIVMNGAVEECKKNTINFDEVFKFAFVRNPFDRFISSYIYCKKKKWFNGNLNQFAKTKFSDMGNYARVHSHPLTTHLSLNSMYIEIDYLNFIGKVENLQHDFNIICDKIGIPHQQLTRKNVTKHKHYTEYYDDETRSIVAEKYAKDIEYFGYKFGN